MDEQGLFVKDCDAVCVSAGPGSYTGLRVGASTAKGLCFGADIKLLSVPTTDVLVAQALSEKLLPEGCKYIVPMIDARRMEVYSALYDAKGKRLTETKAEIIDENSYSSQIQEGPVLFIGDGAAKCSDIIKSDTVSFVQTCPNAGAEAGLRSLQTGRVAGLCIFRAFLSEAIHSHDKQQKVILIWSL